MGKISSADDRKYVNSDGKMRQILSLSSVTLGNNTRWKNSSLKLKKYPYRYLDGRLLLNAEACESAFFFETSTHMLQK